MTKDELKAECERLMRAAQAQLSEKGVVDHVLILRRHALGDEVQDIGSFTRSAWPQVAAAMEKRASHRYMMLAHVDEAWLKAFRIGNRQDADNILRAARAPSTYDDREEVIIVEAKNDRGELVCLIQQFDRDGNGKPIYSRPAFWFDGGGASRVLSTAGDL